MRTGIIAEKIGMTQIFAADGTQVPVTVLKMQDCVVVGKRTIEKNGYEAVELAAAVVSPLKVSKSQREKFSKVGVQPRRFVKEFRVTNLDTYNVGQEIKADFFETGSFVDVTGVTVGKGFAGAMKRHNFGGLRASHGVSVVHRSHGSTGNRQDPGKVFKNKKMAGHMGVVKVTKLNLSVYQVDAERNLIFIKGAVPGPKGGVVYVRDAIKRKKEING